MGPSVAIAVGLAGCFSDPPSAATGGGTTDEAPLTGTDPTSDPTVAPTSLTSPVTSGPETDGSDTDSGETDVTTDGPPDTADSSSGHDGECNAPTGNTDSDCTEPGRPYCHNGSCVGCAALPLDTCADVYPDEPACDLEGGDCVQCTLEDADACGGDTPVCVDDICAPCTSNPQCESGICQTGTGQCQAASVELEGRVLAHELVSAPTPVVGAQLTLSNLLTKEKVNPTFGPTAADGVYTFSDVPTGSLLDVEVKVAETWSGAETPAFRTVQAVEVGLDGQQTSDLAGVRYEWLAEVAVDCGVYDFMSTATPWDVLCTPGPDGTIEPGCSGADDGISTFALTRSTVVGSLHNADGSLHTEPISRGALSVVVTNGGVEQANVEGNPGDGSPYPFHVCWLQGGDELEGSTSLQNSTGHFVLFRVVNSSGTGQGSVAVGATGFDNATVRIPSTGAVGVVRLRRNTDAITRDFAVDVYPMFEAWNCTDCHFTGGGAPTQGARNGYLADWSLGPLAVYENVVLGDASLDCGTQPLLTDPTWGADDTKSSDRNRVCPNAPDESLLIMRPTAGLPLFNEVHPIDIFPGPDHPQMTIVREWIEQGAQPPANVPVDFETDVYPIFAARGCIGCHYGCDGPQPGPGCVTDTETDTYLANWNATPDEVYEALIQPGTDCSAAANGTLRVCIDDPLSSLLITRPMAGVPAGDPHPIDIFATEKDPDVQTIRKWIEQGALQ